MDGALLHHFNSISVISARWVGDNERLCAIEPHLQLKRFSPEARLETGTARSAGQHLTHLANGASQEGNKKRANSAEML